MDVVCEELGVSPTTRCCNRRPHVLRARANHLRHVVRRRRVEGPPEALVEPVSVARVDKGQLGEEQANLESSEGAAALCQDRGV